MAEELRFDLAKQRIITPYTLPLLLWDVVEKSWSDRKVEFTEEYPREDVSGATIVWSIYRRVPGKEGLEIYKPRFRGAVSSEDGQTTSDQFAQWHTVIYEFDLYHISNQEVNKLVEDFEDLMYLVTVPLKEAGVGEWLFDEQIRDKELSRQESQEIYRRTLRYRCIIERKYIRTSLNIQSIWLKLVASPVLEFNKLMVRNSVVAYDILPDLWISQIIYIGRQQSNGLIDSENLEYVSDIDYKLNIKFDGQSSIEWTPNGKHPKPGESFYVSYIHRHQEPRTPVTKQEV